MTCLDIGRGGGDVVFELARIAGPAGKAVGTDIDEIKLDLARVEGQAQELGNTEFRLSNIADEAPEGQFDLVHARCILTHLPDPAGALVHMRQALRPGGVIVVEDIDFRGYFSYPDSPDLWRYVELYRKTGAAPGRRC